MKHTFIIRDCSLEGIRNKGLGSKKFNEVVNLLMDIVHLNIGKKWMHNVVHLSEEICSTIVFFFVVTSLASLYQRSGIGFVSLLRLLSV